MEKPKRRTRINRPQDIKRILAKMINDVMNDDDISTDRKAQLIATLSNSTLKAIESGDIADRMNEYEKQLDEYKQLIESQKKKGRHR